MKMPAPGEWIDLMGKPLTRETLQEGFAKIANEPLRPNVYLCLHCVKPLEDVRINQATCSFCRDVVDHVLDKAKP